MPGGCGEASVGCVRREWAVWGAVMWGAAWRAGCGASRSLSCTFSTDLLAFPLFSALFVLVGQSGGGGGGRGVGWLVGAVVGQPIHQLLSYCDSSQDFMVCR